jgi:hypothetical protein
MNAPAQAAVWYLTACRHVISLGTVDTTFVARLRSNNSTRPFSGRYNNTAENMNIRMRAIAYKDFFVNAR